MVGILSRMKLSSNTNHKVTFNIYTSVAATMCGTSLPSRTLNYRIQDPCSQESVLLVDIGGWRNKMRLYKAFLRL